MSIAAAQLFFQNLREMPISLVKIKFLNRVTLVKISFRTFRVQDNVNAQLQINVICYYVFEFAE